MLTIDLIGRSVSLNGEDIPLTPTEHRAVWVLCRNRGRFVSSDDLIRLAEVGNPPVYIMYIRRKGIPIESRRVYGYRITVPVEMIRAPLAAF
jgi:DNA-binding response OmpR family regulator